jgi:DNA-binding NarL/FixJ family response regulator
LLTPDPNDDQLFRALKSGAVALVTKSIAPKEFVSLLKRVGGGAYPINEALLSQPNAANKVLQLFNNLALMGEDIESLMSPLSHREMEVLKYIAEGNPNKQIAGVLNTSQQTIKNQITSIMRKLNANDRTHAVVIAVRRGFISIEETAKLPDLKEVVSLR